MLELPETLRRRLRCFAPLAALIILSLSAVPAHAQPAWVPTLIGTEWGAALGVNDHGQVVGYHRPTHSQLDV